MRPALDSPGAALDRVKMWIYENFAQYGLPCPVTGHPSTLAQQRSGGTLGERQLAEQQQQQQQQPGSG